jgi:predicted amidophosphoribosyltransferase
MDAILIVVGTLLAILVSVKCTSEVERPHFICGDCEAEMPYGRSFCVKCGREKDWSNIEKSDAPLPIYLGKWRIKV